MAQHGQYRCKGHHVHLSAPREPARLFLLGRRIVDLLHLAHEHLKRFACCVSACHTRKTALDPMIFVKQLDVPRDLRTDVGIVLG